MKHFKRFLMLVIFLPAVAAAESYTVDIFATVPGCGDNFVQGLEECDGGDLGGTTCSALGFDRGTLSCSSVCTFITNSCEFVDSSSSGTKVGSRSSVLDRATNIVVSGYASPLMNVTLLKDGQRVATVPVKSSGDFQLTISGVAAGTHILQLVGTTVGGDVVRSEAFVAKVQKDATTKISGVVLPASGKWQENDTDTQIVGAGVPGSVVSVSVLGVAYESVVRDDGTYSLLVPMDSLGEVEDISITTKFNGQSKTSQLPKFVRGNIPSTVKKGCVTFTDTSSDCRVNLVDFFIVKANWLKGLFASALDFDKNGKIDIADFSVMAYYWTG